MIVFPGLKAIMMSNTRYNPFTEQTAGKYFVGRETELQQFEAHLRGLRAGAPKHLYVAGLHGTGKTSYLERVVVVGREQGFVAERARLDKKRLPAERLALDHVHTIMRSIVKAVEEKIRAVAGKDPPPLVAEWDREGSEQFRQARLGSVASDAMAEDFEMLETVVREHELPGVVLGIDEGQRLEATALSALKNALQDRTGFLLILSLRLAAAPLGAVEAGREILNEKAIEAEADIGASRFFLSGVAMGPFKDDSEAVDCLRKRLAGNAIQFSETVMRDIARIERRVPRGLISLASDVYDRADRVNVEVVGEEVLDAAFRESDRHRAVFADVLTLLDNLSKVGHDAIRALIARGGGATAGELSEQLHPSIPTDVRAVLASAISAELDRVCELSLGCSRVNDHYEIGDSAQAYALACLLRAQ
jgi:AAA ATPase domain